MVGLVQQPAVVVGSRYCTEKIMLTNSPADDPHALLPDQRAHRMEGQEARA